MVSTQSTWDTTKSMVQPRSHPSCWSGTRWTFGTSLKCQKHLSRVLWMDVIRSRVTSCVRPEVATVWRKLSRKLAKLLLQAQNPQKPLKNRAASCEECRSAKINIKKKKNNWGPIIL